MKRRLAIIGGGPSALFLYKRLVETEVPEMIVEIFESKQVLGSGMPYSHDGANAEHITNVSGNEIPALLTPIIDWIGELPEEKLLEHQIDRKTFSAYKVFPRLLFGEYLRDQFEAYVRKGTAQGIQTTVHLGKQVFDIIDLPDRGVVRIQCADNILRDFDAVVLCTGHSWPKTLEGTLPGYFDSPYPPAKIDREMNHPIAIRGSSLTAIDAIRTLARRHGCFTMKEGRVNGFNAHQHASEFKIVLHSRQGLLPGIRFHLEDPRLATASILTREEIDAHRQQNDGFLSLDFIFEKDFKESFKKKDPDFYRLINKMTIETFVDTMMDMRNQVDPFVLFKQEYAEALNSIRHQQSIYWKEMLASLSFAMNYPAKHFSAEDMHRLHHVLMPLISLVIAFVPQRSCEEMIALHAAGRLELIAVGTHNHVAADANGGILVEYTDGDQYVHQTRYDTFIDCIGQRHLNLEQFPFRSMISDEVVTRARLKFRNASAAKELKEKGNNAVDTDENGNYYLKVDGLAITDNFRAVGKNQTGNPRIYLMAVAYLGGYNPDYSGLDFCEEASKIIVQDMLHSEADSPVI